MGIRIRTLKEMARTKKTLYRVRWRCWERSADGFVQVDNDGERDEPSTWGRWEEEYFISRLTASKARDPHSHLRPTGIIDQVQAYELWATMQREARKNDAENKDMPMQDYDAGRLRVLYPVMSGPWRLPSDRGEREEGPVV